MPPSIGILSSHRFLIFFISLLKIHRSLSLMRESVESVDEPFVNSYDGIQKIYCILIKCTKKK